MKQPLYHANFDKATNGGFSVPSVNALISFPGIGRTLWALEQAFYLSKMGTNTLFITLESSIQDNIERLVQFVGKEEVATHPMSTLHFVESNEAKVDVLQQVIAANVEKNQVQVVWIDGLDYLVPNNRLFMTKESDYIAAIEALEAVAITHNLTIIFTKQLGRTKKGPIDQRPALSVFGSKKVTDLITSVVSLYRDEQLAKNRVTISLLKHGAEENLGTFQEIFLKAGKTEGIHTIPSNSKE